MATPIMMEHEERSLSIAHRIVADALPESCIAGLDVLAAAAAPLDCPEEVNTETAGSDDCAGLVVADAVVEEALPHAPYPADHPAAIIARQQQEIAALRELVTSQAAAINQLRRAASVCQPQGQDVLSTSPPPLHGPASPSSELTHLPAEDLESLSPAAGTAARPTSGLQHVHGFHPSQLALVEGGRIAGLKPLEVRPSPTPTHQPLGMSRTLSSHVVGEKRPRGADGQSSAAPSPSTLPYTAVTLALSPFRSTVSGTSRPSGRTNTHVLWSTEEDDCLRRLVAELGEQAWALVARRMPHGRNNKQCRERWRNHLRPQCNKGPWTEAEDAIILRTVGEHGTKWARISGQYLPDRPENDIKNRWHILVRMHPLAARSPSASDHTQPSDQAAQHTAARRGPPSPSGRASATRGLGSASRGLAEVFCCIQDERHEV